MKFEGPPQSNPAENPEPQKSKRLPIGSGERIEEIRQEFTLPAVEVDNEVVEINPAFPELPFNIKRGDSMNLGVFFTPKPSREIAQPKNVKILLEIDVGGRSGLLGAVIFKDKDGRLYRDVDAKGIGYFRFNSEETKQQPYVAPVKPQEDITARGLLDYRRASHDMEMSEKLIQEEIRTHRVIAISRLKEIVNQDGRKITIPQAKHQGIIPKEMDPVIQIRAFGTGERIHHLYPGGYKPISDKEKTRIAESLNDARTLVAQELGKVPETFSLNDYAEWFAATLGKQVAKLRRLGLSHRYLTAHNITLDCRIIDLDSLVTTKRARAMGINYPKRELYENDLRQGRDALHNLLTAISEKEKAWSRDDFTRIKEIFDKNYTEEFKRGRFWNWQSDRAA